MDIYTAIVRIVVELLTVSNGILSHMVNLPANASGPLDPDITLTDSGVQLVQNLAITATRASDILCDMFEALF